MLQYKIDILEELKNKGYTPIKMRKEKILSESTIQKLRNNIIVSSDNIGRICVMLKCQPGEILESVPTDEEKIKYY